MPAIIFSAVLPYAAETLSTGGMIGVPVMVAPEALFHTLASDFAPQPDGTMYVQTGDIPAMWLRDSAAQTLPYVRLARDRPRLKVWIRGVIERDARNIAKDSYANAFRVFRGRSASGIGSSHTPPGYVWPLALISRALTSTDRREVLQQLQFLAESAGPNSVGQTRCTLSCSFARPPICRLNRWSKRRDFSRTR